MTHADDQALTLNEILDLMDTLQEPIGAGMTAWNTLRAVLDWGGTHELFTMAEAGPLREVRPVLNGPHGKQRIVEIELPTSAQDRPTPVTGRDLPGDRPAGTPAGTPAAPSAAPAEGTLPPDDATRALDGAVGTGEIPAGPHDDADGLPAPRSGAAAHIEGPADRAPEAPEAVVPPVAGGGTKSGVAANFSAPAWTEEQDRTAIEMKLAGRSNREIAEAVGRPVKALTVRLSAKLKARLAQARAEIAEEPDSGTDGEPSPEGGAESGVLAAAHFAEQAPAGAAEETGDSPAAVAPTPAPVLRVVAAAAVHWHERMTEREIERHLASLPADPFWTPERDFRLAHALWVGEGAGIAAERLGCQKAEAVGRWRQLCPVVNLDNQRHLNAALKARLGELAPAAAAE